MGTVVRTLVGIVIDTVSFFALGTIAFIVLRVEWPAYAAADNAFQVNQTMLYDQSMMIARLSLAGGASIIAGWLTALTLRDNRIAPMAGGLALLALFVPIHAMLWNKFPIWYHLTFLTSLPVLAFVGGKLARTAS